MTYSSRRKEVDMKKVIMIIAVAAILVGCKGKAKSRILLTNYLLHPASEVPRNDNGKVLAFSRVFCNRKLYDMNAMLDKTTCNTYQEMWEEQVYMFHLSDWIFVDELFDLIIKGGECK